MAARALYVQVRTRVSWVVSTHYQYTTRSLVGILGRKLILPSVVALCVCPSVHERVCCVFPKKNRAHNFHFKWGNICVRLNFERCHDAAWRHSSHLRSLVAVDSAGSVSIRAGVERKTRQGPLPRWPEFNLNIFSTSFSPLFLPGWRTTHQWKCCSWLTRNETATKNRVLIHYSPIKTDYVWTKIVGQGSFFGSVISQYFPNSYDREKVNCFFYSFVCVALLYMHV